MDQEVWEYKLQMPIVDVLLSRKASPLRYPFTLKRFNCIL